MPEETKVHQLTKQLEGTVITSVADPSLTAITATNGWEGIVMTAEFGAAVQRTYFDLAGWSRQELSSFVQGVDIQKMKFPFGSATKPIVWEYDILSTRRLTTAELSSFDDLPGFLPNTVDLMQVVYGELRMLGTNANIPGTYVALDRTTFGTGDATAMDKLHWTRLIVFLNVGSGTMNVYPTNCVVQSLTTKEKDLVWMERLRRSYVLQDQADV